MKDETWVFIKNNTEVDRKFCTSFQEADLYEKQKRQQYGKWCDSWCTAKNANLLGYVLKNF